MNDRLNLTDEQLRLATSRTLPPGAELDAKTQAARDSFVAIGAAVDAAAGELDEAGLLARLSKTCLGPIDGGQVALKRVPARGDWWPMVLGGAMALAALIAIARIATVSPDNATTIAANHASDPPAQPLYYWSDPLDDEIALAAATIGQLGGRTRDLDGSLNDMNERLDALAQELSGEAL
jgi:hypothetical protein